MRQFYEAWGQIFINRQLTTAEIEPIVEYAFRDMTKPMGVATYKIATELPDEDKYILSDVEQLKQLL
jgi:hypothetical protein